MSVNAPVLPQAPTSISSPPLPRQTSNAPPRPRVSLNRPAEQAFTAASSSPLARDIHLAQTAIAPAQQQPQSSSTTAVTAAPTTLSRLWTFAVELYSHVNEWFLRPFVQGLGFGLGTHLSLFTYQKYILWAKPTRPNLHLPANFPYKPADEPAEPRIIQAPQSKTQVN